MPNIKLTIAYDGTRYAGMQWQRGHATIQSELERALAELTGEPVRVTASGRTDSGVHALAQVVNFVTKNDLAVDVYPRALNAALPDDIAVLDAELMPDDFHSILAARRKRYRYVLHDAPQRDVFLHNHAWRVRRKLDTTKMNDAAQLFVGTHDFAGFQGSGSRRLSTTRTVFEAAITRPHADQPHVIYFEVEAEGFLYNMVRVMIGSLVDVGRGVAEPSWISELLEHGDRKRAGMTAPAHGLFLMRVDYESECDPDKRLTRPSRAP